MSKKSSYKAFRDELPKCLKFLRNASDNTIKNYQMAIDRYEEFHGTTIESLVLEALDEQENNVPTHRLNVISRLEDFQEWLIDENYVVGTVTNYMTKIKSVYHKNRVDLPYIEPINSKRVRRRDTIEFKDILTKDELKRILPLMRLPLRARAMAMLQSGLSNEECEHLTTRSFIDELRKYHQCDDDVSALKWLANEDNPVIWITKLIRVKTGKPYYAIIGAEAVNLIASAKLYEIDLGKDDISKLFNTNKKSLNQTCIRLNKKLGLGQAGGENRLKPHALRKFHATYIRGGYLTYEEQVISNREIDEMQGRGKTSVQDTYIKSNPLEQKLIYAKVMNNVSLYHEYDYHIIDNDVQVFLRNPLEEKAKLEEKVNELESKLENKKKASLEVQKLREKYGNDVFEDMIGEILNAS